MAALVAGQHKTVTTAGGGQEIGSKTYGYCLRTDGSNNATIEFRLLTDAGTLIWTDICLAADLAKPHSFEVPLGQKQGLVLVAVVVGTGAEADIQYD